MFDLQHNECLVNVFFFCPWQFFDRLTLFGMPAKHQPDFIYLRHVPLRKVHLFTIIQLSCLVLLWVIKTSRAAIVFPMMVSNYYHDTIVQKNTVWKCEQVYDEKKCWVSLFLLHLNRFYMCLLVIYQSFRLIFKKSVLYPDFSATFTPISKLSFNLKIHTHLFDG